MRGHVLACTAYMSIIPSLYILLPDTAIASKSSVSNHYKWTLFGSRFKCKIVVWKQIFTVSINIDTEKPSFQSFCCSFISIVNSKVSRRFLYHYPNPFIDREIDTSPSYDEGLDRKT